MSKVKIGSFYNLGIGFGDSANFEVISIKGDTALLKMIDFGGPHQSYDISYLESLEQKPIKV